MTCVGEVLEQRSEKGEMTMSEADTELAHEVLEPEAQPSTAADGAAPSENPAEGGARNTAQTRTTVKKASSKRVTAKKLAPKTAAKKTSPKKTPARAVAQVAQQAKFPRHSVEKALRIPNAIYKQNAGKPTALADAARFSTGGKVNGPFTVEVSSAKKYGFLRRFRGDGE